MKLLFAENLPTTEVDLNRSMSEEEFFNFCIKNPELVLERDKDGNIIIIAPVFFESGNFESEAIGELIFWNRLSGTGMVFSSSAGFTLPNGAVRSPDASWISNERLAKMPNDERKKFAHICPDFVLEIKSESDRLSIVQEKMLEYMENGARLGFLIDPKGKQAFIFRENGSVEQIIGLDLSLSGEAIMPGFILPLSLFQSDV